MGRYHIQKCPICFCNIQVDGVAVERCPACKEYILDKLDKSGDGTGITTATASGPGLKPLKDMEQDVFG